MKKSLLALAALLVSSPALSADMIAPYLPAPADIVVSDWTGFYIGAHGGYGAGTMFFDPPGAEQDVSGWLGGVQLGYRQQFDQFVLGIQTDLSATNISSDEAGGDPDDTLDWYGSTTLRAGFSPSEMFLVYALGGVAYSGATGYNGVDGASNTHLGWTAGLGAEVAVTQNVSLFAEYAYSSFGNETYSFPGPLDIEANYDIHTIKAGLNFSF